MTTLIFELDKKDLKAFKRKTKLNGENMSRELRSFIKTYNKDN